MTSADNGGHAGADNGGQAAYFPLLYAMTCGDYLCGVVFDRRAHRRCPACGFALALPLSRYLNGPARREKAS